METGAWRIFRGQRFSSEAENFTSMCEDLGLIPPIQKGKRIKKSLSCCITIFISPASTAIFLSPAWGFLYSLWTWVCLTDVIFFLTVFSWLLLTLLSSSLHLLFYLLSSSPDKNQWPPSSKVSNHVGEQVGTVELSESVLSTSLLPRSFPTACALSFLPGRVFL